MYCERIRFKQRFRNLGAAPTAHTHVSRIKAIRSVITVPSKHGASGIERESFVPAMRTGGSNLSHSVKRKCAANFAYLQQYLVVYGTTCKNLPPPRRYPNKPGPDLDFHDRQLRSRSPRFWPSPFHCSTAHFRAIPIASALQRRTTNFASTFASQSRTVSCRAPPGIVRLSGAP